MNRFYHTIYLLIAVSCLIGCDSPEKKPSLDYLPVKIDKDDLWGMINSSGKMLFSDEFENEPSPVINGIFSVKEDDGYSLYKAQEKPILIPGAESLKDVGYYNEGLIPVVRNEERISLIDSKGQSKHSLSPIEGEEVITCCRLFLDGNLIVQLASRKWGAVNKRGEVTIKPIYDQLDYAGQNIFIGHLNNDQDNKSKVLVGMNRYGKELFQLKGNYEPLNNVYLSGFLGGRLAVTKGDGIGYINLQGDFTKLPSKFKDYQPFSDNFFGFENENGKWGVVNSDNEVILRAKYDRLYYLGNNLFYVRNGDKNQIIDSEANVKADIDEEAELLPGSFIDQLFKNSFGLVGGPEHSLMFFGLDGRPSSKTDFYSVGTGAFLITYDMYIKSDYNDYVGVMNKIADGIDSGGYKDARLGYSVNKFIEKDENPSDYVGRRFVKRVESNLGYLKSNVILRIYGDTEIASTEPIYDYYSGFYNVETALVGYEDRWNNSATIKEISLSFFGAETKFKEAKDALVSKLTKKGFNVDVNEDNVAVLTKDDTNILVQFVNDQFLVTILPTKYNRAYSFPHKEY